MSDFIIENGILVRYTGKSKEVVVPKGIAIIGNKAFAGQDITKVTIPEGVTTIGDRAFYECANLAEVSLPESAKFIEQGAFGFCRSLRTITIPDGIVGIASDAFKGCDHLTDDILVQRNDCITVQDIIQDDFAHICRCCGYKYIPDELIVDGSVCPACDWEEDGTIETEYSYFNGASLMDYRKEYFAKKRNAP